MNELKSIASLPKIAGIYSITNSVNGKKYVGQSKDIYTRWSQHRTDAYNENRPVYDHPLYKAIRRYGEDKFECKILETFDQTEDFRDALNKAEIKWIKDLGNYIGLNRNGYNLTYGGEGTTTIVLNEDELQNLISLKEIGKTLYEVSLIVGISEPVLSDLYRSMNYPLIKSTLEFDNEVKRMRLSGMTYRQISEATGRSIGAIEKSLNRTNTHVEAKPSSGEYRNWGNIEKIAPFEKEILSKYKSGASIRGLSKEYKFDRRALRKFLISRGMCIEQKAQGKARKRVAKLDPITDDVIDIYNSITKAGEVNSVNPSSISAVCNKRKPYYITAGGFKWKYI